MPLEAKYRCTQKCFIGGKLWKVDDIMVVPEKQKVPENCFERLNPPPKEEAPVVLNSKKPSGESK